MGRWAQANRRGGGNERPRTAYPASLGASQSGGFWVPTWTSTTDPIYWRVSVQRWNGSAYVAWNDYVVNGSERSVVTNLPQTDNGQFKMRSEGGGVTGEFTPFFQFSGA